MQMEEDGTRKVIPIYLVNVVLLILAVGATVGAYLFSEVPYWELHQRLVIEKLAGVEIRHLSFFPKMTVIVAVFVATWIVQATALLLVWNKVLVRSTKVRTLDLGLRSSDSLIEKDVGARHSGSARPHTLKHLGTKRMMAPPHLSIAPGVIHHNDAPRLNPLLGPGETNRAHLRPLLTAIDDNHIESFLG